MVRKVPLIYLDTVIIRKLIEKKPADLINLMQTIKERKWKCFTSTFAILELSDLKKDDVYLAKKVREKVEYKEVIKERDQKELSNNELLIVKRYIDSFLENYPYFSAIQIPVEVWKDALSASLHSNVQAKDAIHLIAALYFGADVLVTYDTHLIQEGNKLLKKNNLENNLKIILPEKVYCILTDMGFKMDS